MIGVVANTPRRDANRNDPKRPKESKILTLFNLFMRLFL